MPQRVTIHQNKVSNVVRKAGRIGSGSRKAYVSRSIQTIVLSIVADILITGRECKGPSLVLSQKCVAGGEQKLLKASLPGGLKLCIGVVYILFVRSVGRTLGITEIRDTVAVHANVTVEPVDSAPLHQLLSQVQELLVLRIYVNLNKWGPTSKFNVQVLSFSLTNEQHHCLCRQWRVQTNISSASPSECGSLSTI
ncbi:tail fiber protein [Klebsiella phage JKP2]|uniref:Tail fiber protein n=1 Tax=Klebsiella phage JKP2 TaxID=2936915 RepID=A0A9E7NYA1_9CAUD|nr:tail fiber protein [Klebsiella phage JKP2]